MEDLPQPEVNLSNFMLSRGSLADRSGNSSIPAGLVMWDTGNFATSFISEVFFNANRPFFEPLTEDEDSQVSLADGKSVLNIKKKVRTILTVKGVDDRIVHINTTFSCIPMPKGVNIILGLKDMIYSAPDMLVSMIHRAAEHVAKLPASPVREDRRVEAATPLKRVHIAQQTGLGKPRMVRHPRPHRQLSNLDRTMLTNMGRFPGFPRLRTDLYAINTSFNDMTFDEALNDLTPTEAGQDVRAPWMQRDDLGEEEKTAPYPGMFTDYLAFMETPVAEARAEYLAEVNRPPLKPPPEPPPDQPPPTTPRVDGASRADQAAQPKPAKRERFHPAMYDLPGFKEYMATEAIDVFVPTNWEGIKVPPIEFQFKEDMPDTHRCKARPINPKRAAIVQKEFDRLRTYHLVRSNSSIVSPITDADKATAPFVRICGDYRWVNTQILLDHEHIPHVRHELEKFAGFNYFIDLDMVNSFHQFRLAQQTSEKLSVITPWGSFRPVFMPEGVSPATGVLQGHMREMFKDFSEWAVVIFDNFCIGGDSMEDLFSKLKLFVARCKEFNIFLKMSKCFFGHDSVKFFGYEVSGKGWKIDAERKAAIKAIPFPTGPSAKLKIQRMQSFLGFSLYFRDFVNGYSTKAAALYDMTTKFFDWREETWTRPYRELFEKFKDDMCDSFELIFPDYSLPWVLQPDASNIGIGAILFQIRTVIGEDGVETTRREPIACVSQKFSDPATRWAVIKQEMYAIFRSVEKLSYYLKHKRFQVQTDHSNLVQMEKSSVGIITRWRCFLQSFPITSIIHVAGKNNVAADFLSRVRECDRDVYEPDLTKTSEPPIDFLAAASFSTPDGIYAEACEELGNFTASVRQEFLISECDSQPACCSVASKCQDSYCHDCGVDNYEQSEALWASLGAVSQPADMNTYTARIEGYDAILESVHGGPNLHFGALATWRMLQERCVGHGIPMAYVRFYVRECAVCQKYRRTLTSDRVPHIIRHLKVPGPRSTVGVDGFTMTPPDRHGNSYMHVLVNQFTKHVFLYPSKSKDAENAANALITYISLFGRFDRLISDPGSDYSAQVVAKVNEYFGHSHAFSLVDRHESNGVETTNREIKRHIQTLVHDKRFKDRWSEPQVLGLITFHINNQRNSESGYSAFDCTFGSLQSEYFRAMDVESASYSPDSTFVTELTKDIEAIQEKSREFQMVLAETRATDLTKPRNEWSAGDLVFVDNLAPAHKLQAPRLGPYEVVSHRRNDVTLRDLITEDTKDFHVDRLSLFSGSASEAFDLAMRDKDQHFIERFMGYRGDVNTRETLEFLISYTDDPTPVWRRFEKDIYDTVAYENYCRSLPQLEPLLSSAVQQKEKRTGLLRTRTDASHQEGDAIYVDLRSRELYEPEFYNALTMANKDIIPRYCRLRVGRNVYAPGSRVGTRVELLDDVFGLVHRVDSHFLRYNGSMRDVAELPESSEILSKAFADMHPYVPLDQRKHRDMEASEADFSFSHLSTFGSGTSTFRVLSYNVNGLDSALRKGFLQQLQQMEGGAPDVLILQETRSHSCTEREFEKRFETLGYVHFKMVEGAPHYQSGVAVVSKTPFSLLPNAPGIEPGRAIAVRMEGVTVVNVYVPIVCSVGQSMVLRRQEFDAAFLPWLRTLPQPIVIGGDFNAVADRGRDMRVFKAPPGGLDYFDTVVETHLFEQLISEGFTDVFRTHHPDVKGAYTSFPSGSWRGIQARLDYFWASKSMLPDAAATRILTHTPVSDHAGVEIVLKKQSSNAWLPFNEWGQQAKQRVARYRDWFYPDQQFVKPLPTVIHLRMVFQPDHPIGLFSPHPSPPPPTNVLPSAEAAASVPTLTDEEAADAEELAQALLLSMQIEAIEQLAVDEELAAAIALSNQPLSERETSELEGFLLDSADAVDATEAALRAADADLEIFLLASADAVDAAEATANQPVPSAHSSPDSFAIMFHAAESTAHERASQQQSYHFSRSPPSTPPPPISIAHEWNPSPIAVLISPSPPILRRSARIQAMSAQRTAVASLDSDHLDDTNSQPQHYDYHHLCWTVDLDRSIPPLQLSQLYIAPSQYGWFRRGILVYTVGDALFSATRLRTGQYIARFTGSSMTTAQALALPDGLNNYLIQISDTEVLDCSNTARTRPVPGCYASIANMAEGLHSNGTTLTIDDNNCAAWLDTDDDGCAVADLYAVTDIPPNTELMWSYGRQYAHGFQPSQSSTLSIARHTDVDSAYTLTAVTPTVDLAGPPSMTVYTPTVPIDHIAPTNNVGEGNETREDSSTPTATRRTSTHSAYSYPRVSWFDNPDYDEPPPDSYFGGDSSDNDYSVEDDPDLGYDSCEDPFHLDFQEVWDQAVEDFIFRQIADDQLAELSDLSEG